MKKGKLNVPVATIVQSMALLSIRLALEIPIFYASPIGVKTFHSTRLAVKALAKGNEHWALIH